MSQRAGIVRSRTPQPDCRRPCAAGLCGLLLFVFAGPASAQGDDSIVDPSKMPGPLKEVSFEQQLGERLPLDAIFRDEAGREVALGDYFGAKPVVLSFVYYDCPMLCPLTLNGLAKSLDVLKFDVGGEFDVVVVSFDASETPEMARQAKQATVERYGREATGPGWHFLTGDEESVRRLTEAAGFEFTHVPQTGEFAHASGILIATPDGTLSKYFYGIEYPPKDVRLALVEASENRIGTVVDQILLYCFRYDPTLGKYTAVITRVVRLTGIVFSVGLAVFLWIMWRRDFFDKSVSAVGAPRR